MACLLLESNKKNSRTGSRKYKMDTKILIENEFLGLDS